MAYNPNFQSHPVGMYPPGQSLMRPAGDGFQAVPPARNLPPPSRRGDSGPDQRFSTNMSPSGVNSASYISRESTFETGRNPYSYPSAPPAGPSGSSSGGQGYGRNDSQRKVIQETNDNAPYANHTERRDPDAHRKLIGERIQRERPCRTLFVRNVTYEANSAEVLRSFEAFGETKHHFDLVKNRGMLFVTYFDYRAAEQAKEAMHATKVLNRPIDVHYSLPRADELSASCDRDKNQGSLLVSLSNDREADPVQVRRACSRFGDIKELRPGQLRNTAVIEFFDSRATVAAYDALNDTPFEGARLLLKFIWDEADNSTTGRPANESSMRNDRRTSTGRKSPERQHARSAPYPDRKPTNPVPAVGRNDNNRLQDARKIQDLLASIGNIAPTPVPAPAVMAPPPRQAGPPNLPRANIVPPYAYAPLGPSGTHQAGAGYPQVANQLKTPLTSYPAPPIPQRGYDQARYSQQTIPSPQTNNATGLPANILAAVNAMNNPGQNAYVNTPIPSFSHPPTASPYLGQPQVQSSQAARPSVPADPNSNGNTTQAMTQLLALLVAQQQK